MFAPGVDDTGEMEYVAIIIHGKRCNFPLYKCPNWCPLICDRLLFVWLLFRLLKIAVYFFTACFVLVMGLQHMLLILVSHGQTRNSGYHSGHPIFAVFYACKTISPVVSGTPYTQPLLLVLL